MRLPPNGPGTGSAVSSRPSSGMQHRRPGPDDAGIVLTARRAAGREVHLRPLPSARSPVQHPAPETDALPFVDPDIVMGVRPLQEVIRLMSILQRDSVISDTAHAKSLDSLQQMVRRSTGQGAAAVSASVGISLANWAAVFDTVETGHLGAVGRRALSAVSERDRIRIAHGHAAAAAHAVCTSLEALLPRPERPPVIMLNAAVPNSPKLSMVRSPVVPRLHLSGPRFPGKAPDPQDSGIRSEDKVSVESSERGTPDAVQFADPPRSARARFHISNAVHAANQKTSRLSASCPLDGAAPPLAAATAMTRLAKLPTLPHQGSPGALPSSPSVPLPLSTAEIQRLVSIDSSEMIRKNGEAATELALLSARSLHRTATWLASSLLPGAELHPQRQDPTEALDSREHGRAGPNAATAAKASSLPATAAANPASPRKRPRRSQPAASSLVTRNVVAPSGVRYSFPVQLADRIDELHVDQQLAEDLHERAQIGMEQKRKRQEEKLHQQHHQQQQKEALESKHKDQKMPLQLDLRLNLAKLRRIELDSAREMKILSQHSAREQHRTLLTKLGGPRLFHEFRSRQRMWASIVCRIQRGRILHGVMREARLLSWDWKSKLRAAWKIVCFWRRHRRARRVSELYMAFWRAWWVTFAALKFSKRRRRLQLVKDYLMQVSKSTALRRIMKQFRNSVIIVQRCFRMYRAMRASRMYIFLAQLEEFEKCVVALFGARDSSLVGHALSVGAMGHGATAAASSSPRRHAAMGDSNVLSSPRGATSPRLAGKGGSPASGAKLSDRSGKSLLFRRRDVTAYVKSHYADRSRTGSIEPVLSSLPVREVGDFVADVYNSRLEKFFRAMQQWQAEMTERRRRSEFEVARKMMQARLQQQQPVVGLQGAPSPLPQKAASGRASPSSNVPGDGVKLPDPPPRRPFFDILLRPAELDTLWTRCRESALRRRKEFFQQALLSLD